MTYLKNKDISTLMCHLSQEQYNSRIAWLRQSGIDFTLCGPFQYGGKLVSVSFNLNKEDAAAFRLKFGNCE